MEKLGFLRSDLPFLTIGIYIFNEGNSITAYTVSFRVGTQNTMRSSKGSLGFIDELNLEEVIEGLEPDLLAISKVNMGFVSMKLSIMQPLVTLESKKISSKGSLIPLIILKVFLGNTIQPHPHISIFPSDFQSLLSKLDNSRLNKRPPGLNLGSDVNGQSKTILVGWVINKNKVTASMEL